MAEVSIAESGFNERLSPIIEALSPLKVKVTLLLKDDVYYLNFDGNNTYTSEKAWDSLWMGFRAYIRQILDRHGFSSATIYANNKLHVTAKVGSVFDFLKE